VNALAPDPTDTPEITGLAADVTGIELFVDGGAAQV
jgi:hypothetical protein